MSAPTPDVWRQRAAAAANPAAARAVLAKGLAQFPANAALANSAGHFAMQAGDPADAERLFARAVDLAPGTLEFALNHAISLTRLGRDAEAGAVLAAHEQAGQHDARYCSARAANDRACGHPGSAAQWYDRCLALAPTHARALHGRAHVALERGEDSVVARFEAALAANQSDPIAWLGLAQAFDVAGETTRARELAQQLVVQLPHWDEGLRFLAQLRLAAGERDFASHFAEAEKRAPREQTVALAHIEAFAGLGMGAEAMEVAARARARFPDVPGFALHEAINAGLAGDDARAEAIFAALPLQDASRLMQEARHRIRIGQYERAEDLLARAETLEPWVIGVWAIRSIVWRLLGDPREQWLHGQDGLYRLQPLPDGEAVLASARPLLDRLHDASQMPLSQSLRGGTQTRGSLFARTEPELARLHTALMLALEEYRATLPPADPNHPLLRLRTAPWQIVGSWSVRLGEGGDHHTAHIHPQGVLSSALYVALPDGLGDAESHDGWLELGRPPPDLRLDLPPLAVLRPCEGHLALFPSTLYHGTRPFHSGRRMTVAFDVALP